MSESRLADRIRNGSARVTVIGQGYVGLPLAVEFARAGFNTTGLDTDLDRVIALNAGQSYTPDGDSELLKAMFEARGARIGIDFFLAFSPERIDPANGKFGLAEIPKVVGGVTAACSQMAALLYSQIIKRVLEVSSPKVAELAKLYENTFRNVNIALANEFSLMGRRLGVNIREVIEAAATKPFGFMPFYPGPGVGGHCIG